MRTHQIFLGLFLGCLLVFGQAHAGEWANMATYDKMVEGHMCDVSISPRGFTDIDCPETNPEVTASGIISATGISVTGAISTSSLFVNGTEVLGSGGGGGATLLNELSDVSATTPTEGDLLYFNGSVWTPIAHGTAGQFLQTQGAGVAPQYVDQTFSDYVESPPLNINTNGDTTFNHGLGENPKFFGAKIICTTANNGYSIGDELVIDGGYFQTEGSIGVFANGTVIGVTMGTTPRIPARGGGSGTHPPLNTSQWDIVLWGAL